MLERDIVRFREFDNSINDQWVIGSPVSHRRSTAEGDFTMLGMFDVRTVCCMRHIENEADVRLERVGSHGRSVASDLFLDCI